MSLNKENFIHFARTHQALRFGDFTLKSGRISPYFFNIGMFHTGSALQLLGQYYAQLFQEHAITTRHLLGPAYKGIPLATATALALSDQGIDTKVSFNRKEVKDHGEGGVIIGAPLDGPLVMIDDVITAGTAFREAQTIAQNHNARITTVLIALDREERGNTEQSAITSITKQGIQVHSIISASDVIRYLEAEGSRTEAQKIRSYLNTQAL